MWKIESIVKDGNFLDPEVFPWSCGIEIESHSEFKESSALGDSSKDSTEGSSQVELRYKATVHSDFDIYTRFPFFLTQR